jgi:hypothetical protein
MELHGIEGAVISLGLLEGPGPETLSDALFLALRPMLSHPDHDFRASMATAVAGFAWPERPETVAAIRALYRGDPDPVVRDCAWRSLRDIEGLPQAAPAVWRPHMLRAFRRWWLARSEG